MGRTFGSPGGFHDDATPHRRAPRRSRSPSRPGLRGLSRQRDRRPPGRRAGPGLQLATGEPEAQPRPHGSRVACLSTGSRSTTATPSTSAGPGATGDRPHPGHRHPGDPAPGARHSLRPALRGGGAGLRREGHRRSPADRAPPLRHPRPLRPHPRATSSWTARTTRSSSSSARLALESVSHYGDNGLPREAAEVLAAAEAAGPVPFEAPHLYRARMRELSRYMKEQGTYPEE